MAEPSEDSLTLSAPEATSPEVHVYTCTYTVSHFYTVWMAIGDLYVLAHRNSKVVFFVCGWVIL